MPTSKQAIKQLDRLPRGCCGCSDCNTSDRATKAPFNQLNCFWEEHKYLWKRIPGAWESWTAGPPPACITDEVEYQSLDKELLAPVAGGDSEREYFSAHSDREDETTTNMLAARDQPGPVIHEKPVAPLRNANTNNPWFRNRAGSNEAIEAPKVVKPIVVTSNNERKKKKKRQSASKLAWGRSASESTTQWDAAQTGRQLNMSRKREEKLQAELRELRGSLLQALHERDSVRAAMAIAWPTGIPWMMPTELPQPPNPALVAAATVAAQGATATLSEATTTSKSSVQSDSTDTTNASTDNRVIVDQKNIEGPIRPAQATSEESNKPTFSADATVPQTSQTQSTTQDVGICSHVWDGEGDPYLFYLDRVAHVLLPRFVDTLYGEASGRQITLIGASAWHAYMSIRFKTEDLDFVVQDTSVEELKDIVDKIIVTIAQYPDVQHAIGEMNAAVGAFRRQRFQSTSARAAVHEAIANAPPASPAECTQSLRVKSNWDGWKVSLGHRTLVDIGTAGKGEGGIAAPTIDSSSLTSVGLASIMPTSALWPYNSPVNPVISVAGPSDLLLHLKRSLESRSHWRIAKDIPRLRLISHEAWMARIRCSTTPQVPPWLPLADPEVTKIVSSLLQQYDRLWGNMSGFQLPACASVSDQTTESTYDKQK